MAAWNGFSTRYARRTHWGMRYYKARSVSLPLAMYISIVMNRYLKWIIIAVKSFSSRKKRIRNFVQNSRISRFTVGHYRESWYEFVARDTLICQLLIKQIRTHSAILLYIISWKFKFGGLANLPLLIPPKLIQGWRWFLNESLQQHKYPLDEPKYEHSFLSQIACP